MGPESPRAASITVLSAPACHFCDDAERTLADLSREFVLEVEHVGIEDARGQALITQHRPPMTPLILVDGAWFSSGRLNRKKLADHLRRNTQAARPEPVAHPVGARYGQ